MSSLLQNLQATLAYNQMPPPLPMRTQPYQRPPMPYPTQVLPGTTSQTPAAAAATGTKPVANTGFMGMLGEGLNSVLGDGIGTGLLTSGLGFLGNTLGTSMLGSAASSITDAIGGFLDPFNDAALDMQERSMDNVLERQRSAMLNNNAMGQIGQSAALGVKQATDAQRASAQGTYALGQAENSANSLLANARAQAQQNMQLAQKNLGSQRSQAMNMMNMAGGPASAATRSAQAAGQASADTMLGMAAQNNQSMQSAFSNAAQIRGAGNQAFIQDKQNQYNTYVAPYLNKWENNLGAVAQTGNAGLGTSASNTGASASAATTAAGYMQDPLEGMTMSIGSQAEQDTYRRVYGEGERTNPYKELLGLFV